MKDYRVLPARAVRRPLPTANCPANANVEESDCLITGASLALPVESYSVEFPGRRNVKEKCALVLRVLGGEDIGVVAREAAVSIADLETWLRSFVASWAIGLAVRRH